MVIISPGKRIDFDPNNKTFRSEQSTKLSSIKTRTVLIEGNVNNLSGKYKIKVEDVTEYTTVSPWKDQIHAADGYMLIHREDDTLIDIMEKTKEDKMSMLNWLKKTRLKNI